MTSTRNLIVATGALIGLCALGFIAARVAIASASQPPATLGLVEGQLSPCPESPNCVTSRATDREHAINPLVYTTSTADAHARLEAIMATIPRLTIIKNQPDYIHAETRSLMWGFVDDNEFYFDESAGIIEIRAAARLGQSDLNKNRERLESIRAKFELNN
jgi:uncharacterized protein (DUF1499 family)